MTRAPRSRSATMVGSAARMRVSSVIDPVVQRHVEVDAAEHPAAGDLQRIQTAREGAGHRYLVIRSTRRFEKPHSLSYQEMTFAWRPWAIVSFESKIDEYGLPTMSCETISSSV